MAEWLGRGLQNLVQRFEPARRLGANRAIQRGKIAYIRALGSGGERFLDTEEVGSSNLPVPTTIDLLSALAGRSVSFPGSYQYTAGTQEA